MDALHRSRLRTPELKVLVFRQYLGSLDGDASVLHSPHSTAQVIADLASSSCGAIEVALTAVRMI